MIKNLFLDRDGIINEIVLRGPTVGSPRSLSEFRIRDEFLAFYRRLKKLEVNLFVISNQPDVARALMSRHELDEMTILLRDSFEFKEILYCMHDEHANCFCRKPKPGLITTLLEKYELKKDESLLIGDGFKDIMAGRNAGIRTVFVARDYNRENNCYPTHKITNLEELFTSNILQENQ